MLLNRQDIDIVIIRMYIIIALALEEVDLLVSGSDNCPWIFRSLTKHSSDVSASLDAIGVRVKLVHLGTSDCVYSIVVSCK